MVEYGLARYSLPKNRAGQMDGGTRTQQAGAGAVPVHGRTYKRRADDCLAGRGESFYPSSVPPSDIPIDRERCEVCLDTGGVEGAAPRPDP